VGPIYINVVLLLRCRVISGTHLKFFKRCWVGGVEYLLSTIIKKLKISDVYTWDPVKYSKMGSFIVDALTITLYTHFIFICVRKNWFTNAILDKHGNASMADFNSRTKKKLDIWLVLHVGGLNWNTPHWSYYFKS
jgi:hypothetical protein